MTGSRHPLLTLTPAARRELARTLLRGLQAHREGEQREIRRAGVRGAGAVAGAGLALGTAWVGLAGGALAPFAAAYAAAMVLQGLAGRALAGEAGDDDPGWARATRAFALAPHDVAHAVRTAVAPDRISPDRLVLAAGLLVAVRHPLSSSLLRRLVGRAYPVVEVDRAIALLVRMGYVAQAPTAPGVLLLTPAGVAVLRSLGVSPPEARPRRDPDIAPHLLPLFAALDARGRPGRPAPDMPIAPIAPLARLAAPEPEPDPLPEPEAPAEPGPERPRLTVVPDLPPAPPVAVELPRPGRRTAPIAPPPPARPAPAPAKPWRLPVPALAAAGMVAAFGLLLALFPWRAPHGLTTRVIVSAENLPHSTGTALQFNGRGFLLSSFGGDLFLSIPERLDYKRPLSFQGFDMAADCGLVDRDVRAARMAPNGRFLWAEMEGAGLTTGRERCLVDLETKTVTHDLPSRQPAYGLAHVVGWAGPQTLLMAPQAPPEKAARWWAVDVTSHAAAPVDLPPHARLLPLATEGGPALLAGFDPKGGGAWDLTTYWLGDQRAYQKVRTIRMTLPDTVRDGDPHHAALSPDKRYMLLGLRASRPDVPAAGGALVVVSLEDGTATYLDASPAPLVEAPLFWGPEVREGRYRFYFNGTGPDGVVPWSGEMLVTSPR